MKLFSWSDPLMSLSFVLLLRYLTPRRLIALIEARVSLGSVRLSGVTRDAHCQKSLRYFGHGAPKSVAL